MSDDNNILNTLLDAANDSFDDIGVDLHDISTFHDDDLAVLVLNVLQRASESASDSEGAVVRALDEINGIMSRLKDVADGLNDFELCIDPVHASDGGYREAEDGMTLDV